MKGTGDFTPDDVPARDEQLSEAAVEARMSFTEICGVVLSDARRQELENELIELFDQYYEENQS